MIFPNHYYDAIKPLEIHVYYGSSFGNDKWCVKGEQLFGMYTTREEAIKVAQEVAEGYLFPITIFVHSFGKKFPNESKIKIKNRR